MIDLYGQKFGKLTVIKREYFKNNNIHWLCKCDCGKECIVSGGHLKNGHTKSCGCLKKRYYEDTNKRIVNVWKGVNQRCSNKNCPAYKHYGERGIKCEWNNYLDFKRDMYQSYLEHCKEFGEKDTTIDRVDNNGNYSKENCRWATMKEQQNNRRNNHFIELDGESKTLSEWSIITGINKATLLMRLKNGWSEERALKNNN